MSDEATRQFLDTNVLFYAHDRSTGKKHEVAADLVRQLWADRQGCLSIQVLQEFYVTITRKAPRQFSREQAAEIVEQLGLWRMHRPTAKDLLGAIRLQIRYGISFWDAMIVQSASRMDCTVLWSEELSEGQRYGNVTVRNPFAQLT